MELKWLEEKIKTHETRINSHSDQLKEMSKFRATTEIEIRNLVEQIKSLVTTIKWFGGISFTTLVGFLIWYIQKL